MTSTCSPCNNFLGALLDRDLIVWFDDAFSPVRITHPNVRGHRATSRVLRRQTSDGKFVLIPEGHIDREIADQLREGADLTFFFSVPDPDRVRLAVLKSAYLSACLLSHSIIDTPEGERVQRELLAIRDRPRRKPIGPLGPAARSLEFSRADGSEYDARIALLQMARGDAVDRPFGVSMMGDVFATWIFGGGFAHREADGSMRF